MKNVPADNPHMWRVYHGPEPFEEMCDLSGVFRYAERQQLPEPPAGFLPCPEPWPENNFTDEDLAVRFCFRMSTTAPTKRFSTSTTKAYA